MKRRDVVTFGEVLWDIYETGSDTYRRQLGGAPANLAVVLARLGVRSAIVGGVGKDAFGDALTVRLAREGVDVSGLIPLQNRTGIAFVSRDARGEPSFLFYRHQTADMMVECEHVASTLRGTRATFAVLGTSTLVHESLRAATLRFVDLAAASGAAIVVDLNVREHLWKDKRAMRTSVAALARRAALVKASTADLRALGGAAFLSRHAPRATTVVTAGSGPARAFGAHGVVERSALRVQCVDATGAGDAFLGGALAVLVARGAKPGSRAWVDPAVFSDALAAGHMLGAKAVSKVGAVSGVARLGEVRRIMRDGAKR